MPDDSALRTSLLDLLWELRTGNVQPIVAGGYGLYIKQTHLREQGQRTLLDRQMLPAPRSTKDLDLFLRAEVVADSRQMGVVRQALDRLGFLPKQGVEYLQFVKHLDLSRRVQIDFLVGPAVQGADPKRVKIQKPRAKPRPPVGLHAYLARDAIAVEEHPLEVPLSGRLSNGEAYRTTVLLPQSFTYLLMKLCAFRDRKDDRNRDFSRHHALDIYRIIGMLTESEYDVVKRLCSHYASDEIVQEARRIVAEDFRNMNALGVLRVREHPLFPADVDAEAALEPFLSVLAELLACRGR